MDDLLDAPVQEHGPLGAVTREIVKMHSRHFGRGPRSARSEWVGPDGILCLMRETFTAAESTLIKGGHGGQVREVRQSLQDVMKSRFREVLEEILGRRVIAILSQIDVDEDVAVEFVLLAPRSLS